MIRKILKQMDNMPVLRALSEMVRKIYYFCISFPDYIKISLGFDARGTTKSKIRTSVLAPSIQQARAAERELSFNNIKEWTFLAGKIAPQKNQVILDIGANIGYASLLFREVMPAADIYAFEPSPTNLTYLRTNLKETGVNVEAIGLGAQEMEANLSLPEYVLGAGEDTERNTGRFSIYGAQNENSENIKIMTLDSWWKSTNQTRKIAFIKIDVEGAELDVLRGGIETILKDRPILLIELNKTTMEMAGWGPQQLGEFFEGMNYSFSTEKDQSNIMEAKKLKAVDLEKRVTDVWVLPDQ